MLGSAMKDKQVIWSTGEASKENVKGNGLYYWAMAEKRLKDRLTLKLINAYEYGIYSDVEAEAFKEKKKTETKMVGDVEYEKRSGNKNGRVWEGWLPIDNDDAPKFWTDDKSTCDAKIGKAIMDLKADKEKPSKGAF